MIQYRNDKRYDADEMRAWKYTDKAMTEWPRVEHLNTCPPEPRHSYWFIDQDVEVCGGVSVMFDWRLVGAWAFPER